MLDRRDIDLNSVHIFRITSKNTIKQTMLNQELVFRRQVFELHELCRVQRAMTEDIKQKGSLNNYNLHNMGMIPVHVNQNDQFKCSLSENINLHYDLPQQPVLKQKPIDLQFSADEFISQCRDGFSGRNVVTSLKESVGYKNPSHDKVVLDVDPPNLSLSIGRDPRMKGKEHASWKGKEICSSPVRIIDLENSNVSFSNYEAYLDLNSGSLAPKSCSGGKQKLDSFMKSDGQKSECFAQSGIMDNSFGVMLNRSPVDASPSCQKQSLCDPGFNGHLRKFLPANNKRELSICKVNTLDLNTIQVEEPSYFSNNYSMMGNSTITSSSPALEKGCQQSNVASSVGPISWRKENVNQLMDLNDTPKQKESNLENTENKCGKVGEFRDGGRGIVNYVNLDSDSSGEVCCSRSDPKFCSVGPSSKISNEVSSEMKLVDTLGAKVTFEKEGKFFEQPNCCKLSSSSESECMDHQSSSIKTMQSGVGCDDINISTSDKREKVSIVPLATHSGEQELSLDSIETNAQYDITKEDEVDGVLHTAAEVLVQISSVTRAICQDDPKNTPEKKFQNAVGDQPQCSSESYEAMVLNAEESSPDEYFLSSNAYLVDISETKDAKYKLKRGTRMRDFQKDIFPCLSTLERHEIREDINVFESVIRSREYKRTRGKMADDEGDWCRSTRSKRSKAGRRYYA